MGQQPLDGLRASSFYIFSSGFSKRHHTSGSMRMMEALEEVAPIVTGVTRGQGRLGDHEDRQHIPRSEMDQDQGPNPARNHLLGGDPGPRGQYRGHGRRVNQDQFKEQDPGISV